MNQAERPAHFRLRQRIPVCRQLKRKTQPPGIGGFASETDAGFQRVGRAGIAEELGKFFEKREKESAVTIELIGAEANNETPHKSVGIRPGR